MQLIHISFAVAAALHLLLLAVLLGLRRTPVVARGWMLAAVVATGAWAGLSLYALSTQGDGLGSAAILSDLLRYAAWFGLLVSIVAPGGGADARRRGYYRAAAVLLVAAPLCAPLLIAAGAPPELLLRRVLPSLWLALPVYGLVLTEQLYRSATEMRWAVKPLCLGLGLIFVFDVYFLSKLALFGAVDGDAMSVRALVHACSVPLLLLGHVRLAKPGQPLVVSRTVAFHTAALLLVGGYLLLTAAAGYYVRESGGTWGTALQLAGAFVALLALLTVTLSETLRAKLRVFIGKHFFAYRYDYRTEWLRFTATLSAASTPQQVGELVVRGLADMVESPGGAVFTTALDGRHLVQSTAWNMPRTAMREQADSSLVRFLRERDWIVDLSELRQHPERYDGLALPAWCSELAESWLVLPLRSSAETLTGFVVLARPRTPVPLDWEVRDLLKTAGRQAAGFLAQMHATEALLESRKFEAFNRMSAFVVHDLKNIVTQLSLMMKNAQRLKHNPEFQDDMLETVDHAVERMRQLITQLREGEKPADGGSGVPLAPLLQRLVDDARRRGREIALTIEDEVAVRGNGERLERVIGHLMHNALDATPDGQRVWITLARAVGSARLVVGDEGVGMTREFVESRLFRPFASTKSSGMGIGAYECFAYVKELAGTIDVDSAPGRGTVITLSLPLLDLPSRSDLES